MQNHYWHIGSHVTDILKAAAASEVAHRFWFQKLMAFQHKSNLNKKTNLSFFIIGVFHLVIGKEQIIQLVYQFCFLKNSLVTTTVWKIFVDVKGVFLEICILTWQQCFSQIDRWKLIFTYMS